MGNLISLASFQDMGAENWKPGSMVDPRLTMKVKFNSTFEMWQNSNWQDIGAENRNPGSKVA